MTKNISSISALLAWLVLAVIIFVTVCPIGLRPHDFLPVNDDRALAFSLLAGLFVVAYPRHWIVAALAIILGAGAIEALQLLSPSRHARIDDAMVKAVGACVGVFAGYAFNQLRFRLRARSKAIKAAG